MSHELVTLSLSDLSKGLAEKAFSSRNVVDAYLNRIEKTQHLAAYTEVFAEHARAQADISDARIASGTARPLEGLPIAVKDLFCTRGFRTTAGSRILEHFVSPYESTVTQRLWDRGAIMLGKTNMDEFAMGSATNTSIFPATRNPWDASRTVGGSSGGSAAAVAVGSAPVSLGSDTGGSVRQPAAFCGVCGIRPSYGRCSRFGMIAYASSFDQAGVFGRNIEDTATVLHAISGHDPKDSTSSRLPVDHWVERIGASVKGLRVGVPKEWRLEGIEPEIAHFWEQSIAWLRDAGCEIVEVSLPNSMHSLAAYYILTPAEASSNLERYDGIRFGYRAPGMSDLAELYEQTRGQGFGWEVKRRILIGTYVLAHGYYDAFYRKAQKVRRLITSEFESVFKEVQVLLAPTTPNTAFPLDQAPEDPVTLYLNDILTTPINIAFLPGLSVPVGLNAKGLPIGMQLISRAFDEATLFQVGAVLQSCSVMPPLPLTKEVF